MSIRRVLQQSVLIVLLLTSGQQVVAQKHPSLAEIASDYSKQLPVMIDSGTRLDTVIGVDDELRYRLTLVDVIAKDFDGAAFGALMGNDLVNSNCSLQEMLYLLNLGIPIVYEYHGKSGSHVATVTIKAEDCAAR